MPELQFIISQTGLQNGKWGKYTSTVQPNTFSRLFSFSGIVCCFGNFVFKEEITLAYKIRKW